MFYQKIMNMYVFKKVTKKVKKLTNYTTKLIINNKITFKLIQNNKIKTQIIKQISGNQMLRKKKL